MNIPLERLFSQALAAAADRRRAPRLPVLIHASTRNGEQPPVEVKVMDITCEGCRIEGPFELGQDSEIWLAIPGIAARRARIAWTGEGAAGCEFVFPVRDSIIESVALTSPREDSPAVAREPN